jgi:hypothetical protein
MKEKKEKAEENKNKTYRCSGIQELRELAEA